MLDSHLELTLRPGGSIRPNVVARHDRSKAVGSIYPDWLDPLHARTKKPDTEAGLRWDA